MCWLSASFLNWQLTGLLSCEVYVDLCCKFKRLSLCMRYISLFCLILIWFQVSGFPFRYTELLWLLRIKFCEIRWNSINSGWYFLAFGRFCCSMYCISSEVWSALSLNQAIKYNVWENAGVWTGLSGCVLARALAIWIGES